VRSGAEVVALRSGRRRGALRLAAWLAFAPAILPAFLPAGDDVLPDALRARLDAIKVDGVKKHEQFLTSEECAGRDTPQPGLDKARDYLVEMHKKFGMTGAGEGGSFLYEFDVPAITWSDGDRLAIVRGAADAAEPESFQAGVDFVPVRNCVSGSAEGEVVFAGYGIDDEKESWDDYKGVDVKGKIVAVLLHEPREGKKGERFEGEKWTQGGAITHKWKAAQEKGALAVLVFTDPVNHKDLSVLKCELPRYGSLGADKPPQTIPVVHCSGAIADKLFGAGKLLEWQKAIDAAMKPAPRRIEGVKVKLGVTLRNESAKVDDVVSCKPGSDPKLKDEWVVLGAHYDHIGVDEFGRIFHGADDNGSGTSCMLEIAEAIGDPKVTFKRSLLLIHFAGEEKGLLGSAAYCKKPTIAPEKVVAMVNMDMVGRGRPHDIDAAGIKYSDEFAAEVRRAIKLSKAKLAVGDGGMQFFKRSDQYEFWRLGIPVLFFMEPKEHEDYHKVTDTMDKLVVPKIVETAKLVTALAWVLSESDRRPKQEGIPK
jgi:peptidase M28-like protein/PA domain-containing protein